jgi:oligopeptide transport system substrate-binding protein
MKAREEKGDCMRTERVRTEGPSGGIRIPRRDFLKIGGAGLAGAALLGTVPGCGVFSQGGEQGGGGGSKSISVNLQDTIRDLNSSTTTDEVSFNILVNIIEGLYRLDENARPEPAQAKGVQISDDKLTYTFTLRDGLKWSNGDPVTSDDFRYSWLKALDPDTGGQYAYILSTFIKGANEFNTGKGSADDVAIEAPDEKTLKVTLLSPSPFWLGLTAFPVYLPQNRKFAEKQGDKYAQSADALLFNGPYLMTQFSPTEGVTFVKNKDYWDAANVDIQKVEGKIVKEVATAVNLHESGDLDITEITQEYVDKYRNSPDFDQRTEFANFYFSYNYDLPFFQNKNIRKAFQMGLDRKTLTDKIINDGSRPAEGLVPQGIAGPGDQTFREAEGPTVSPYDLQKAKEFFQKGVKEVGENPTIELLSYDTSTAQDAAAFMQSQFEKMGAKINVKIQPFDRKLEFESNGEFQLSFQGWGADYNDPMTFLDLWESTSPYNTGKYKNERYDQLIEQAKTETDFAKRMDLMMEAEKLLIAEDAATGPIFDEGTTRLIEPYIKDFVYQPYGGSLTIRLYKIQR